MKHSGFVPRLLAGTALAAFLACGTRPLSLYLPDAARPADDLEGMVEDSRHDAEDFRQPFEPDDATILLLHADLPEPLWDYSKNSMAVTSIGDVTTALGKFGEAFVCDTSNYLTAQNATLREKLSSSNGFTGETWVKLYDYPSGEPYLIMRMRDTANKSHYLWITPDGRIAIDWVEDNPMQNGGCVGAGIEHLIGSTPLLIGRYYHLAYGYNKKENTHAIRIDGARETLQENAFGLCDSLPATDLLIGSGEMELDELRISDEVRYP